MPQTSDIERGGLHLSQHWIDAINKIFLIALLAVSILFGYLLYGLVTGQLANATSSSHQDVQHALNLVQNISLGINISLSITLICAVVLYYESEAIGVILLFIAVFLAYGLNFVLDYISSEASKLKSGILSEATLGEMRTMAVMLVIPGSILLVYHFIDRIKNSRGGPDLTRMQYGKEIAKQKNAPRALIGAAAKCWQLPYCRDSYREKCPIFVARTRCWKQGAGCMCEENIVRLAVGGENSGSAPTAGSSGFIPLGDLLQKSESTTRIPTKLGPRGVRIPVNPNITGAQKRERCRNCVIYNEHQRQKYQLLSSVTTIVVPALVLLNLSPLLSLLQTLLRGIDTLVAHLQFTNASPENIRVGQRLALNLNDSIFIQGVLIFCITLLAISYSLRLLEYLLFQLKI